eukprot:3899757-Rhodomonas_salina.1
MLLRCSPGTKSQHLILQCSVYSQSLLLFFFTKKLPQQNQALSFLPEKRRKKGAPIRHDMLGSVPRAGLRAAGLPDARHGRLRDVPRHTRCLPAQPPPGTVLFPIPVGIFGLVP